MLNVIRKALLVTLVIMIGVSFAPDLSRVGSSVSYASEKATSTGQTLHKSVQIDGLQIFYREAGPKDAPTILLLHGFPTSSHMFRDLIPNLSDKYHVIAPDYPGYGFSSMPTVDEFDYTFDNLAAVMEKFIDKMGIESYTLYLQDYGAPVGFRIAAKNPEKVDALIIQNGNAYEEGLREFWIPLRAYWKDRSEKNAEPLREFL
ncbi:MAG: alpha/beta fold hydrolase, partial [Pirellulales bacterium]|nr:alpha/beta fold hydrolase [Pirellulales bacterium]